MACFENSCYATFNKREEYKRKELKVYRQSPIMKFLVDNPSEQPPQTLSQSQKLPIKPVRLIYSPIIDNDLMWFCPNSRYHYINNNCHQKITKKISVKKEKTCFTDFCNVNVKKESKLSFLSPQTIADIPPSLHPLFVETREPKKKDAVTSTAVCRPESRLALRKPNTGSHLPKLQKPSNKRNLK